MIAVGLGIDTNPATIDLSGGTGDHTFCVHTQLTGATLRTTSTAVIAVRLKVTAGAAAIRSGQTLAGSQNTLFAATTGHTTLSTVAIVRVGIHADTDTIGWLSAGTRERTLTVDTKFTGSTLLATGATVGAVVGGVFADTVAIGGSGGTGTFAGGTDLPARAACSALTTVVGVRVGVGAGP